MAAAREYKVVTQLGNQGHSSGSIRRFASGSGRRRHRRGAHRSCRLRRLQEVYCQLRNLDKLDQTYEVPQGAWTTISGSARAVPAYTPFWVHWNWRGWMPFGTGTIGDWFCHVIDPAFWALDLDAPIAVQAEVTDYDPAKHGLTYPPGTKITFDFPAKGKRGPVQLVWHDGSNTIPKPEGWSAPTTRSRAPEPSSSANAA